MVRRKKQRGFLAASILIGAALLCALIVILSVMRPEHGGALALVSSRSLINQSLAGQGEPTPSPAASATSAPTATPTPVPPGISSIHLRAVGDLMVHERQLLSAVDEYGNYSFDESFSSIARHLQAGDLLIGNLETTIAEDRFSGFPSFRSPVAYIDALAGAGFNVLTFANNHTYDGKLTGIERTINAINERGMATTGAYAEKDAAKEILVTEIEGIKIGILAYADMSFRTDAWRINTFDDYKKIQADIDAARDLDADVVCVMAHWGREYAAEPSDRQRAQAKQLTRMGVDIILGSHPHVLQPCEWVEAESPDGDIHRALVIYSMGNFLSNQKPSTENGQAVTDGGAIFDIRIEKDLDSGNITAIEVSAIPTFVLRRDRSDRLHTYDILPIEEALAVPEAESNLTAAERRRMNRVWDYAISILGEELILSPSAN